ncbi:FYN-binding protein 2-like [Discoglossus pictus]
MEIDTEAQNFISLKAKFQAINNSSNTPLEDVGRVRPWRNRQSSIGSNPAIQNVKSVLENNIKSQILLPQKKPEIAKKPDIPNKSKLVNQLSNDIVVFDEPPKKESTIDQSNSHLDSMKIHKYPKGTCHVDSTRGEANVICDGLPQKYNLLPNTQTGVNSVSPANQEVTEEYYETVDQCVPAMAESFPSSKSPSNFSTNSSHTSISNISETTGSNYSPASSTSSGKDTDYPHPNCLYSPQITDDTNNCINNNPKVKTLPSIKKLGPAPEKPLRPPHVDLSTYLSGFSQNKIDIETIEAAESEEYEDSLKYPVLQEQDCYQDAMSLHESSAEQDNVYETGTDDYATESAYEDSMEDKENSQRSPFVHEAEYEHTFSPGPTFPMKPQTIYTEEKIGKREKNFRKKYKISVSEDVLYTAQVLKDVKGDKETLAARRGNMVDIIRITDCPSGKWLARNNKGNYGFIPVRSVEMDKNILVFCNQIMETNLQPLDVYDDIGHKSDDETLTLYTELPDNFSEKSDNYDDISVESSQSSKKEGKLKGFWKETKNNAKEKLKGKRDSLVLSKTSHSTFYIDHPPEEHCELYETQMTPNTQPYQDDTPTSWKTKFFKPKPQQILDPNEKKLAKEEKQFREKFQYDKKISVISTASVNASASVLKKGKLDLSIKPGEDLEVIDVTDGNKVICRNAQGKYGYVLIEHLNFKNENTSTDI